MARHAHRWTVVGGVILLSIGLASYQAYAAFTANTSGSFGVGTAHLDLDLGLNRLTIPADDMHPGDSVYRAVDLEVDATRTMESPSLSSLTSRRWRASR